MTYRQNIGTKYEYYVLEHIKNEYDKVWHWSEFPEKLLYELNIIKDYNKFKKYRYDIGADLVAIKDNKYYFIQCKNFKETIYIDTLAGFYFLLYENNLNGILYYSGTLSERLVDLSTNKIPFINLPFNNENIVFNKEELKIVSREYQLEAYNQLKGLNNSILSLPCSMGKTYISALLGKDYDNIIILSPTRALAQQNLEKFKEYLCTEYNYVLISMDGKTKIDEINKIIKTKNVISSTFDSCDIVNLLIDNLENRYIIVDEFHNLSENNVNDSNNEINKLITRNINKVFVSATPIKNFMNITNIYTYEWKKAIENKYICDFNIYLPNIPEIKNFIEFIENNYIPLEIKMIKKAYNLIKSMLFNGDKKCICYLTTIEKAYMFNKILSFIGNTFNIEIERDQIDCNTRRTKRTEIIKNFRNSDKLYVLLNVHVLDEGIDIPECDSVYITQPNNNIINIVQRMCRANRIYKNKTECNIYLWCSEKKTNIILDYLFTKTEGCIENKIYKIINNINEKITYTKKQKQELDLEIKENIPILLKFENSNTTIIKDNENNLWFNGYQTCIILDYKNPKNIIKKLVNKKHIKYLKEIIKNYKLYSRAQPHSIYIHEKGLYTLLIKSKKPNAEKFLLWITEDLMISNRKNKSNNIADNMINQFNNL
jgi:superfamily II DNA or RNA helicase